MKLGLSPIHNPAQEPYCISSCFVRSAAHEITAVSLTGNCYHYWTKRCTDRFPDGHKICFQRKFWNCGHSCKCILWSALVQKMIETNKFKQN